MIDMGLANPFQKYMACKIIEIKESKEDADGKLYSKVRFVYNAVEANSILKPLGYLQDDSGCMSEMTFTTPTIDIIFTYDIYYYKLLKSEKLSVFDKVNFYRQFYKDVSNWNLSVIVLKKKPEDKNPRFFIDLCGRMGFM